MLNNCTFQGRFAADPEMRTTQSGLTVASFRMAVDRDNVGQDGRRATDWLNFVAWRKTAEFVCQYFRKGSTALVERQCQTRSYEDNVGSFPPAAKDALMGWREIFTDELILLAIKKAALSGVRKWNYVNGILKAWKNEGVKTLGDVQARDQRRKPPAGQQPSYSQGDPDDFSVIDDSDDLPF